MKTCIACSMPMVEVEDFGNHDVQCDSCVHCTNPDGSVKNCEEIFEGGVHFFLAEVPGVDEALAQKLCRKTMKNLPYWQNNDCNCLQGEVVSDEEYKAILKQFESA